MATLKLARRGKLKTRQKLSVEKVVAGGETAAICFLQFLLARDTFRRYEINPAVHLRVGAFKIGAKGEAKNVENLSVEIAIQKVGLTNFGNLR